jgi:hypothetical protein
VINDPDGLINDFFAAAKLAGFSINAQDIRHEFLPARAECRPNASCAVYVFSLKSQPQVVLKVGQVGPNSGPRFVYQHYNPKSSGSNLAKSLLGAPTTWRRLACATLLQEDNVGDWLKENTDRDHFFVLSNDASLTSLLEVFVQCRLRPLFEG